MSGGFSVRPSELTQHASATAAVARDVEECTTAADQEGVGGLVYGVLFDPTALPLLHEGKQNHAKSIRAAASLGNAIADGLRTNAANYTKMEADAKKQLATLVPQVEETGDGSYQ